MAITKTNFINYIRCPMYVVLDNVKNKKLDSDISLKEYLDEEKKEILDEFKSSMFEDLEDLIDVKDEQLEVMLPYYHKVELLAAHLSPLYFNGTFKFSDNTLDQECFDFKRNGIRYLCYVDIYNETDDAFNIIEVKATTSRKYLELGYKKNKMFYPLFQKGKDGIYYINDLENQEKAINKLKDRYTKVGHYVYDLAVQRYIIENDLKKNGMYDKIDNVKYYLAVLNHEYIFDGTYVDNTPIYKEDINGEQIIRYFDMTDITKEMLKQIDNDRKTIENYIKNPSLEKCKLGNYCEKKKTTKCKYIPVCWQDIPSKNSVFNFIDAHHGFEYDNKKYSVYDLANNNLLKIVDVPNKYLKREKNKIQKQVIESHKPYINVERIEGCLKEITYPIYHLDFETFPCPLPRFKGEKCYMQSVFQYSLHIEREEGNCAKEKDHYGYLASDNLDHRLDLIKSLIENIDTSKGTILVYNASFEKSRLKELASIYPEYKEKLLCMRDAIFDLMEVLQGSNTLYEKLNIEKDNIGFNYYHEDMNGSFSIKKILPLFSNLTYKDMEIANGVEALVTYAKFNNMTKEEYDYKYQKLIEYCMQDTWSMVEILWGLKKYLNK